MPSRKTGIPHNPKKPIEIYIFETFLNLFYTIQVQIYKLNNELMKKFLKKF